MEFRELGSDDFYALMSIIGKLGVSKQEDAQSKIFENLHLVKNDINKFIASWTGKSVEEIKALSAKDYAPLVMRVIGGPEATEVFTSLASVVTEEKGTAPTS